MLITTWQLEVYLEYSQVWLEPVDVDDPQDPSEVFIKALADGIAQGNHLTVFAAPHRDVWPMPVTVELWDTAPPDDLADWPEAFEATLTASDGGLSWSSPTALVVAIPVPPGTYRARIAGRDFLRTSWDSTCARENYRLQLWPSADSTTPRRISAWPHPSICECVD